jgi:ribosome recycling factor
MAYDFSGFNTRTTEISEWFQKELGSLRTGRATPAMLDSVSVESYGAWSPIGHVATVTMEDPQTIRITPWDKSQIRAIEQAITKADLGLSVNTDSDGLRVISPALTGELRDKIAKNLRAKLEDARIEVRKARQETIDAIKKAQKDSELSEDESHAAQENLQKFVDKANAELEVLADKKEAEIRG